MHSTLVRLKNLQLRGRIRIPWAERAIDEYVTTLERIRPELARRMEKIPFTKLQHVPSFEYRLYMMANILDSSGDPHTTESTKDPWHASAVFRRKEDFKGSGLSLHIYPDGTMKPSKADFPTLIVTPATAEEMGIENAQWLDPDFVATWQAETETAAASASGEQKGKGKGKAESSSKSSSSKQQKSSKKPSTSTQSSSKGKASHSAQYYTTDTATGAQYRYLENGGVVYLHPVSQREFFYNEDGDAVWL